MPMYEYRCGDCGCAVERYETGHAVAEKAGKCPSCGRTSLKKVFSTFASSCGGGVPPSGGCGGGSSHFS